MSRIRIPYNNFDESPINTPFKFNENIEVLSENFITIRYNYLNLSENCNASFRQDCFDSKDAYHYFEAMKILAELSPKSSEEITLPNSNKKKFSLLQQINRNLRNYLKNYHGPIRQDPSILEIRLYTSASEMANRRKNIKSPRIFCIVGENSEIYPLFYDPYHEIYPQKEEK